MSAHRKKPVETPAAWLRFAELRAGGAVLNEYIVASRYPGGLAYEEIGAAEAKEAVSIARRIQAAVKQGGIASER